MVTWCTKFTRLAQMSDPCGPGLVSCNKRWRKFLATGMPVLLRNFSLKEVRATKGCSESEKRRMKMTNHRSGRLTRAVAGAMNTMKDRISKRMRTYVAIAVLATLTTLL